MTNRSAIRHRLDAFGAGVLAGLLAASAAHAAGPHPFSTPPAPDISVLPGTAVISEPAFGGRPVLKPITLTVKVDASRRAAAVKQVRLFRMLDGLLPPTYNDALDAPAGSFGDCDVYLTVVLPVRHDAVMGQSFIQIQPLSLPFLEVGSGNLKAARWMMVFETSAAETGSVFRLQQGSKAAYFAGGWVFTLTPDRPSYSPAEVSATAAAQLLPQHLLRELGVADRSRPCHIAAIAAAEDNDVQLHACSDAEDVMLP
jgi:hypothetical protein